MYRVEPVNTLCGLVRGSASSHGRWLIVPGSSHLIGNSQPHALAVAVLEMLKDLRVPAAMPAGSS